MAACLRRSNFVGYLFPTKLTYSQVRNGYVVLLPEIPKDTPEDNPLLRIGTVPKFGALTPVNCANGVGKRTIEYESGLCRIEENLQDPNTNKDFKTVYEPLEKLLFPLDYTWSTLKNIFMLRHTDDMAHVYSSLHPRVQRVRAQRFQSLPVYQALKGVNVKRDSLTEVQRRIVDKYLLEARLNGLDLKGYNLGHFKSAIQKINQEKSKFSQKLEEATRRFKFTITDYGMVRDFPDILLRQMALDSSNPKEGPWEVTLRPHVFNNFMQHCSDRDTRWNMWRAYNTRASAFNDRALNNSIHMEEIRHHRRELANVLGYSNYVELSMETKMAATVENVQAMITSLKVRSKVTMEKEIGELQEFAASEGFDANLDLWDIPYWRRKQAQNLYRSNEQEELRHYFPLPHVLKGLFKLCHSLFGITIKDATSEVEVWDGGVSFYKVFDEHGSHAGSFYLDPYFRSKKLLTPATLESGINRCDSLTIKPLAFLIFNFQPPIHGLPSLLTFSNVVSLFEKFGSTLQHVLTAIPYSEVAGLTNIEWDAVDVCSHFMAFWLSDAQILSSLSHHHESGQSLSKEECNKLIKARKHFAAYDLTWELYRSALDLELYTSKEFWLDITRRLWPDFMPFDLNKSDAHPCSFSQIFCEEYHAAYYSAKWAEMIAADVFSAFKEIGLTNEEKIKDEGKRFKDTFLSLGGGCHPSEVFRRFRGRDPSPEALLNHVIDS